jgi:hypothetical protein
MLFSKHYAQEWLQSYLEQHQTDKSTDKEASSKTFIQNTFLQPMHAVLQKFTNSPKPAKMQLKAPKHMQLHLAQCLILAI